MRPGRTPPRIRVKRAERRDERPRTARERAREELRQHQAAVGNYGYGPTPATTPRTPTLAWSIPPVPPPMTEPGAEPVAGEPEVEGEPNEGPDASPTFHA